jgi:hypothetical protein
LKDLSIIFDIFSLFFFVRGTFPPTQLCFECVETCFDTFKTYAATPIAGGTPATPPKCKPRRVFASKTLRIHTLSWQ